MEAIGSILVLVGLATFVLGVVTAIRPIQRIHIPTRPIAFGVIAVDIVTFAAGGALLPQRSPTSATASPTTVPPTVIATPVAATGTAAATQAPTLTSTPTATASPSPAPTTTAPANAPTPTQAAPEPTSPPSPVPTAAATTSVPVPVFYANCDAARAAGVAPLRRGQPGYRAALDRDGDGIACQ